MQSVKKAQDLVTSKEATIQGFSWQASEKVLRSDTFISHADYFAKKAKDIKSIKDIRKDKILTEFIIASCMLSRKSLSHLALDIQDKIIGKLIDFKRLSDPQYLRTLERRYFLTSGDSLGGSMRNAVGQFAQEKLTESIVARLQKLNKSPSSISNKDGKTTAVLWTDRRIIFDKKPVFIDKSIDIIVVKGKSATTGNLENPSDYVCCGELKGGIDPAGADEHWKTAKTALQRIEEAFKAKQINVPNLVFIGAAIESSMANEIFALS